MSDSQLEEQVDRAAKRALQHEYKMKALESKLAENVSNFRAIESLLREACMSLQRTSQRTDTALSAYVPAMTSALDSSLDTLTELADTLPTIRSQVQDIRQVYDSGRERAKSLIHALTYLSTPLPHRLIQIAFTSTAPVSARTRVIVRIWVAIVLLLCTVLLLVSVRGALRVHRVRLVWGERLMS